MALKYAVELERRPDQPCPNPSKFKRRSITAFRFVHNEATDEVDFVPRPEHLHPKAKCNAYGLSFFRSLDEAQARWSSLAAVHDDDGKTGVERYGDHIGEIALVETDGVMDEPNPKSGHIELHPEDGVQFAARISEYTRCTYLEECERRNAS